jgi:frataxin-like iron-binding protein CyaY
MARTIPSKGYGKGGSYDAAKELRMLEKAYTQEMSEQLRARGSHDSDADTAIRILQLTIDSGSSLGTVLNKCTGFIERYNGNPPKKLTNMLGFIQCCMADYYFRQIRDELDASDENIKNFYYLRGFAESNMRDHDGGLPAEFMQGQINELNTQAEYIEMLRKSS